MAEIAGGAVRALLGVISNEISRLGHVGHDVQFIKEEMESMSSFLMHLARTTPPGREHDDQVRTWMKQVRELAQDCSNSIDRYLRHGDPAVYRARSSLGYLWWVPWHLQYLKAKSAAASELRELKARARDVGERRQRYGVTVPASKAKQQEAGEEEAEAPQQQPAAETFGEDEQVAAVTRGDNEDDDGDEMYNSKRRALAFAEPRVFEKCTEELLKWLAEEAPKEEYYNKGIFPAIAIVAPDEEDGVKVAEFAGEFNYEKMKISVTPDFQEPLKILELIMNVLSPPPQPDVQSDNADVQSDNTAKVKVNDPIKEIEDKIEEHLRACTERSRTAPLDVLLDVLRELLDIEKEEAKKEQDEDTWSNEIKLEEAAGKIKSYLEPEGSLHVHLDHGKYKSILQQLLLPEPKEAAGKVVGEGQISSRQQQQQQQEDKWWKKEKLGGEDEIEEKVKETMSKVMAKMLLQLLPPKHDEGSAGELDEGPSHEEIRKKIKRTLDNVRDQQLIEETLAEIGKNLEGKIRTLVIMEGATADLLGKWDEISCALTKMGCARGSAVIVTTKDSRGANKYCNTTQGVPIRYSLVGYYRDKAQMLTERFVKKEDRKNVFGEILKRCEPHEFCMKMFVCALYANPNRSMEELKKLGNELRHCGGGRGGDGETKAHKMIKFFYNELPRDYKTCLLYLAIFPPDDGSNDKKTTVISRSGLVARWVVEGLIAGGDWSKSVSRAKRCFYELTNRWLLRPEDVGVTGKAKSCSVDKLVHNFITKMAREEHITDARLSSNFARHFSIGSDIRLRPSQSMGYFLTSYLSRASSSSSQFRLLKVLDLEGCKHLTEKHLKNVCSKIILLKFLSLRNTDINRLPREINKLQQLEVLDIRQTPQLGNHAIKNLMLTKLKHLLAGTTRRRGDDQEEESFPTIHHQQMPIKTGQMTGLEVLSHVQAPIHHYTVLRLPQVLGQLWQLRKLGVIIYDCQPHLNNLLRGISDLHECIQSLSIQIQGIPKDDVRAWCCWSSSNAAALPTRGWGGLLGTRDDDQQKSVLLQKPPRFLKSLRISGTASCEKNLLTLLANKDALAKLTLENTSLSQDDMKLLAKLDKLCSFKLRNVSLCDQQQQQQLTFSAGKKPTFNGLRYLAVKGGNINSIIFEAAAASRLEKIVWSFVGSTEKKLLSGIKDLRNLQEVELNGDTNDPVELEQAVPDETSSRDANFIIKHNGKPLKLA